MCLATNYIHPAGRAQTWKFGIICAHLAAVANINKLTFGRRVFGMNVLFRDA